MQLAMRVGQEPKLAAAVAEEVQKRLIDRIKGLQTYLQIPYKRTLEEPPVIWQSGACRLLNYSTQPDEDAPAIILVPSLINRYHILDLTEKRSLARFLAESGYHVYLVDWGEPSKAEKDFNTSDYITSYLKTIGEFLRSKPHDDLIWSGHCLGGILTLGLATIRKDLIDAMILLATPWDFSSEAMMRPEIPDASRQLIEQSLSYRPYFPAEHMLAMFYLQDPWTFQDKLEKLSQLESNTEEYEHFMALEHWVHDGVPLAIPTARECLIHFGIDNDLTEEKWRVSYQKVVPSQIEIPTYLVSGKRDRIAPHTSSIPLAKQLPDCTSVTLETGHVGMVVGKHAEQSLWQPMIEWIEG